MRRGEVDLARPSVANVSQLTVADRRRLTGTVGPLPGGVVHEIEDGVRLVLGL